MAQFIQGDELNTYLSELIKFADRYLWFISPYINLNERTKFNLKALKEKPYTEIVIVFGKNENDLSKSVSLEDLTFFKEFPNVRILHVINLHAKYYGSEDFAIITSMNLYEFSQVNNLEAGVILFPKTPLKKLANFTLPIDSDDSFEDSVDFFSRVIAQAHTLFHRKPVFKKTTFGLSEKYESSEVVEDSISQYYRQAKKDGNSYMGYRPKNGESSYVSNQSSAHKQGYCIRTGVEIPFDPTRPFSYDAYQTWAQFSNYDYPERFCHKTGRKSDGKTSMRNPVI